MLGSILRRQRRFSMELTFHWCAPMYGDSGYVGTVPEQPPTIPYFVCLFRAAERAGLDSLLMGAGYDQKMEAWTTAAAVLAQTECARALVATRPGFYHPAICAKLAATVDQISGGRVSINVVTGGNPDDLAMYGDYVDHDSRYRRTAEFIRILRMLCASAEAVSFHGEFYDIDNARLDFKPLQRPSIPIYFGGASEAAKRVAAKEADIYLMWGETVAQIAERVAEMRRLAALQGRGLRFGLRINIIARPTESQAWEAAEAIVSKAEPKVVGALSTWYSTMDSVGQQRMLELHQAGDVPEPHLWTGMARYRVGAGTAIVGDYAQVAAKLFDYAAVGVQEFILAGYPHLGEAERFGESLLPLLRPENRKGRSSSGG